MKGGGLVVRRHRPIPVEAGGVQASEAPLELVRAAPLRALGAVEDLVPHDGEVSSRQVLSRPKTPEMRPRNTGSEVSSQVRRPKIPEMRPGSEGKHLGPIRVGLSGLETEKACESLHPCLPLVNLTSVLGNMCGFWTRRFAEVRPALEK